jgi:transposase-like protein
MPKRPKRRMQCKHCGSLETRKNGTRVISPVSFDRRTKRKVQRYECRGCGVYFCRRREAGKKYTMRFKLELARMHVEERMSYRVIGKRVWERLGKRLSPKQACAMVNEVAQLAKSSLEIKREYEPNWSGYLIVDDKWVRRRGDSMLSLVAVDGRGDPLHSELDGQQTQEVYDGFLLYLRDRMEYPLKAITTDFDPKLDRAVRRVFGLGIPHQKCLWHAGEIVKGLIEYPQTRRRYQKLTREIDQLKEGLADRKQSLYDARDRLRGLEEELVARKQEYGQKEVLLKHLRALLFVRKRDTSQRLWRNFRRAYAERYPLVIRFIATHWEGLLQHQRNPSIPKTTARAENINRQFERRLKTIEAFQRVDTAFHYQNLFRNYLRFKPFTDCRGKARKHNGQSPLQLCGVTIRQPDWIKNAVRQP